ncbi:hypothetical protein QYM36_001093 [Artemia franciscana]|uniref:Uncharacterized protein n=1 Tax=Artemia franciscana TaxID=6661 RepID=A0AA88IA52_ARTSF|nr:hypothetical protein QYM36_001093 [Artemia franciscana]
MGSILASTGEACMDCGQSSDGSSSAHLFFLQKGIFTSRTEFAVIVNVVASVKPASAGTRLKQNVEPPMFVVVVVMTILVTVLVEKKRRPMV